MECIVNSADEVMLTQFDDHKVCNKNDNTVFRSTPGVCGFCRSYRTDAEIELGSGPHC